MHARERMRRRQSQGRPQRGKALQIGAQRKGVPAPGRPAGRGSRRPKRTADGPRQSVRRRPKQHCLTWRRVSAVPHVVKHLRIPRLNSTNHRVEVGGKDHLPCVHNGACGGGDGTPSYDNGRQHRVRRVAERTGKVTPPRPPASLCAQGISVPCLSGRGKGLCSAVESGATLLLTWSSQMTPPPHTHLSSRELVSRCPWHAAPRPSARTTTGLQSTQQRAVPAARSPRCGEANRCSAAQSQRPLPTSPPLLLPLQENQQAPSPRDRCETDSRAPLRLGRAQVSDGS